ncbi:MULTISPECIES: amino acid ABC transporter permease [Streptomyces]|uniref:Amino acid ABC transporter permease n=2 Tax=Streptomyces TaxID=1883 RepID=A0A3R7J4W2_9ACTN|nr:MULTISPECIES: amino acid ABC transporter permease [Streptomyces]KNE83124.1 cystine transporter permease [Streptomyces fradiae]MCC3653474.1 amino acid ABC transporter permease [Streptomyces sp. S07_1.15]OFA40882.1 cystine transporter permease [Streptomyces fradiae]PQM20124.1 amino acid ABC transporter permease [Streptomyces xinghaiensis]RKM96049.1 amino acid ABC transporter permease [Streptomyces xinghaiensis]
MSVLDGFSRSLPLMLEGLRITLSLAALAVVFSLAVGLVVAWMRMSRFAVLRWLAQGYLAIIRGTPLVAQLFVIYYGLVTIVDISSFWSAVIGLTVHTAAYMAEIFRSGVQSVVKGQTESARSLGMSRTQALRIVVAPQAFRSILPSLGNQFIIAVKDTAVASFITVPELFMQAQKLAAATYEPLTYYLISAVYYLVIVLLLTALLRRLERRHSRYAI